MAATTRQTSAAARGLEGFPSWEINGELDSGVKPLEVLADLSGYQGDREF